MPKTLSEELTLGQRLARARKEAGMSQGDLADAIGVSRQTISNYETGGTEDLRFDIVARWGAATDVALEYFGATLVRSVTTQSGEPTSRYIGSAAMPGQQRFTLHAERSERPSLARAA
jgi:transcriptional regulator with XRE-family HTH domain